MKKNTLYFIVLLCCQLGYSQLFVKDNSYMFVKNTVLYAKNDINLGGTAASVLAGTEAKIYLRNEAQLVQGKTGSSANDGLGKVSIFQEGTSNAFGYNYWCSPVGFADGTIGNRGFGVDMFSVPTTSTASTAATILPMNNYNGASGTGTLSIAPYWINTYVTGTTYTTWTNAGSTTTHPIIAGRGFSMKGVSGTGDLTTAGENSVNNAYQPSTTTPPFAGVPSGQRYDFRGRANDGDISIPVSNVGASGSVTNNTLAGNPYPSAINLNLFLLENSGKIINYTTGTYTTGGTLDVINGSAYFWEHQKPATSHNLTQYVGGYGVYVPNGSNVNSPGTYNNAPWNTYNGDGTINTAGGSNGTELYKRMFAPVGQGFMIQGKAVGNAVMKNLYRAFVKESVATNSTFEKNGNAALTTPTNENWDEIQNVAGFDYTQFSKAQVPQIKLHTIFNNTFTKEITVAFNSNTTDGYDVAMDGLQVGGALAKDVYFPLDNDVPYVISTLPFEITKRIPLTLRTDANDNLKIAVGNLINFTQSNEVYLYDAVTGVYHNIVTQPFEITLPAGVYSNRFEITFENAALSNPVITKNDFIVVQNNTNQLLSISNPNTLAVKSVALYDISGKQIFNKTNLEAKTVYEFPTQNLSEGVYLVKLQTADNQSLTQKIIVNKK